MDKHFLSSKTIWFNLATLAVLVAGHIGDFDLPLSADTLDAIVSVIASVGNVALRFFTKVPVRA